MGAMWYERAVLILFVLFVLLTVTRVVVWVTGPGDGPPSPDGFALAVLAWAQFVTARARRQGRAISGRAVMVLLALAALALLAVALVVAGDADGLDTTLAGLFGLVVVLIVAGTLVSRRRQVRSAT